MKPTILDGSIGQELVRRQGNTPTGLWSTKVMMEEPQLIRQLHDDYFAVGAEIATTNTYPIHRDRLVPHDIEDKFEDLHKIACEMAVQSRDAAGGGLVAGAIGPSGWSYRPDMAPPAEQAAELFEEIARLHQPYVDFHILETMASVDQARGGMMGVAVTGKPIWLAVSVSDDDGGLLRSNEPVTDLIPLLDELKPEAVLVNCSTPEAVSVAVKKLAGISMPLGVYANGFHHITTEFAQADANVNALEARQDLGPEKYADFVDQWVNDGASIIGGCCEVGPAHIEEIVRRYPR